MWIIRENHYGLAKTKVFFFWTGLPNINHEGNKLIYWDSPKWKATTLQNTTLRKCKPEVEKSYFYLVLEYIKDICISTVRRQITQFKRKYAKYLNRDFIQKEIIMSNKYMKRYSGSLVIKEVRWKPKEILLHNN